LFAPESKTSRTKEVDVARRRFQKGQLFKSGKRRKMWVGRWREDVHLKSGEIRQIRRWQVLGSVAEIPTRNEAQALLDERMRSANQGATRAAAFVTFGAFVEEQWRTLVFPTFKASTQHGYKAVLNNHVLPAWKDWRLRDIERLAIQQWVADKFRQDTGWQVVRNGWVLLSGILETAVEFGYLQTNPARGVKFPQKGLKERPAIIAGDSLAKLLKQVNEPHRTMVSLIAATGLRIGELLALRWSALDLEGGSLTVRESVFEGKFQPPKTRRALRTIPLGRYAVAVLKAHRERASRLAETDLVFGNRNGRPMRESKLLTKVLQPAAEAAGLGRVTWHQFRHIHSSLLNDLRVPAKIAQEQLGHASISTTLSIYTHVVDASHRRAVEEVEERLFSEMDCSGLKLGAGLENASPASDSVN
jgi:integrase